MKMYLTIIAICVAAFGPRINYASENEVNDMKAFVSGNNEFAFDIYSQLSQNKGNIFLSPYSISAALGMTYAGAEGDTALQMRETLGFSIADDLIPKAFGRMEEKLEKGQSDGGYQISIANSIWGQSGYQFLSPFLKTLDRYYGAGLRETDFVKDTEGSRKTINDWVSDETRGRIEDLLPLGVITPLTRMILCNAIYFKGDWAEQFDPKQTKDEAFLCADGTENEVPLMHNKIKVPYMEDEQLQAVNLPYEGENISMLVVLPKVRNGLKALENSLNSELFKKIRSRLRVREVRVTLPRFKTTSQFSLKRTLSEMGMPLAFTDGADFSGMTGSRELYIGAVVHKAFVEVNEEGTEAAAATGVVMTLKSMPVRPLVFRADQPFVFMLIDNSSGSILFMGRIEKL